METTIVEKKGLQSDMQPEQFHPLVFSLRFLLSADIIYLALSWKCTILKIFLFLIDIVEVESTHGTTLLQLLIL